MHFYTLLVWCHQTDVSVYFDLKYSFWFSLSWSFSSVCSEVCLHRERTLLKEGSLWSSSTIEQLWWAEVRGETNLCFFNLSNQGLSDILSFKVLFLSFKGFTCKSLLGRMDSLGEGDHSFFGLKLSFALMMSDLFIFSLFFVEFEIEFNTEETPLTWRRCCLNWNFRGIFLLWYFIFKSGRRNLFFFGEFVRLVLFLLTGDISASPSEIIFSTLWSVCSFLFTLVSKSIRWQIKFTTWVKWTTNSSMSISDEFIRPYLRVVFLPMSLLFSWLQS